MRAGAAGPRQPIVTARPRPGYGTRRREARLRAVERGRAASSARGAKYSLDQLEVGSAPNIMSMRPFDWPFLPLLPG